MISDGQYLVHRTPNTSTILWNETRIEHSFVIVAAAFVRARSHVKEIASFLEDAFVKGILTLRIHAREPRRIFYRERPTFFRGLQSVKQNVTPNA